MKKLSDQELGMLENEFEPLQFANSFDIVYENQVPNTGVVLLEGEAVITKKKKVLESVGPGTVLGIHQLMNNEQVKHGCKICENSRVILLQKSDLMEMMKERDSLLKKAILPV